MAYLKPAPELVSQDPQAFHRWRQLVTSWVCQLCGCTHNRRSILDPTCKTCRHIHVPKRETPLTSGGGQADGKGVSQE